MDSAYTVCQYKMGISDETYTAVSLYAKQEANLEVYYHDDTLWEITSLEKSDSHGICAGKVAMCPLKEQTALLIKNSTDDVLYTYNPTKVINPGASAKILYDDMGFCVNMEPCKIRIFSDSGMAATITVNVQNKLKIESLSSENSFIYTIKQMENFNSAEITNTYNGSFPDAKVHFSNFLNSSVNVLSGGTPLPNTPIAAKDNGFVIYEDVYKKCKNESECTLDVQTYSGLSIGQVLVNMKDEMAILSIESTRPSEIILNQTGQYSVEIIYPYLK